MNPYELDVVAGEVDDGSDWDALVAKSPRAPYQQSTNWAEVKAGQGWRSARVMITRDGSIDGGAQLLYRPLPLLGGIGFVARGPILASGDPALAAATAEGVERLAAASGVAYLIVQPPKQQAEIMAAQLLGDGYRTAPEIMAPHNTTTDVLDLSQGEEAILASMRKSTRRRVRLAQRRHTIVREGGRADLPLLHSLLTTTARRRGFSPVPASSVETAWSTMAPAGMLRMAVAEVDGEPVSAFLWVAFGDTMNCWRGGWSGEHSRRQPNVALDWAGIRWAVERGLRWYDFHGKDMYTQGFGGTRETSPGPLERVTNPLLRPLYPPALHRVLDSHGMCQVKQVIRSRGWQPSWKVAASFGEGGDQAEMAGQIGSQH
jgi:lipid II:glycine glycyltransferase (peptidoglycan interpeptide bridge formation enzyme)